MHEQCAANDASEEAPAAAAGGGADYVCGECRMRAQADRLATLVRSLVDHDRLAIFLEPVRHPVG